MPSEDEPKPMAVTSGPQNPQMRAFDRHTVRISSYLFAVAAVLGGIYRICKLSCDIDKALGGTTLAYFAGAIGFILLPYAKSFEFLGNKIDLTSLEEKQEVLDLKLRDVASVGREGREQIESLEEKVDTLKQDFTGVSPSAAIGLQRPLNIVPVARPAGQEPPPASAPEQDEAASLRVAIRGIRPGNVEDDLWKGQFGRRRSANHRKLSATVRPIRGDRNYFNVVLTVAPTVDSAPLTGPVCFFLHDTFPKYRRIVSPSANGVAALEINSWGAFTVGALADGGKTRLELDLSEDPSFPGLFRSR